MTNEDQATVSFLKAEVEKTYQLLQSSKDREERSKVKIENLSEEITNLTTLI